MTKSISKLPRRLATLAALALLIAAMGGTWSRAAAAAPATVAAATAPAAPITRPSAVPAHPGDDADDPPAKKSGHKQLSGKLNLNTANEEQLQLLPTVGPAKAERIVAWRAKNGGFKRVADLRRVKGFGYKTLKKLEPYLDIKGDTTLAAK
ncbi:MAG TPA: helix-hairpin-helix domain-containing protein [Kofleriaceae bacterium]|nr:helix-hairpin-helix domain-containing protein [Kofleriaceae bacterium]